MRSIIAALMSLSLAGGVMGETWIGMRLESDVHTQENYNSYRLRIGPLFGIMIAPTVEVAPSAAVLLSTQHTANTPRTTQGGFALDCGLYFRLLDAAPFALSLGPDAGMELLFGSGDPVMNIFCALPMNIDLSMSERWKVRVSGTLAWLNWHHNGGLSFDWNMRSILSPSLTLYYLL